MRTPIAVPMLALLCAGVLSSAPAEAHFKLQAPADRLQTDATGDPLGTSGTQKQNPCGDGTPSGAVTTVEAGSMLHIKLTETVGHGGHYRVALVPKTDPVSADLPEPEVTLASGQCDTAAIESPVQAPVLADDLFPHTQAEAKAGTVYETDVQLPNDTGDATLQVIEFMTPHAPSCFYHHCAELKIVAAGTPIGDGGTSSGGDAGAGAGGDGANGGGDSGGCGVSSGAPPSPWALVGFATLVGVSMRRRRRARRGT